MRKVLFWLSALAAGIALGAASLQASLAQFGARVPNGPWVVDLNAGSAAAGPYTRATIAINGLLALDRSETVYFFAETDSGGDALRGGCTYRIEGRDPPARWWSITAYGPDRFLMENPQNKFSESMNTVARDATGRFAIRLAPAGGDGDFIPTAGRDFGLTLRLYNPAPEVVEAPGRVALPAIVKEGCA